MKDARPLWMSHVTHTGREHSNVAGLPKRGSRCVLIRQKFSKVSSLLNLLYSSLMSWLLRIFFFLKFMKISLIVCLSGRYFWDWTCFSDEYIQGFKSWGFLQGYGIIKLTTCYMHYIVKMWIYICVYMYKHIYKYIYIYMYMYV